jgi:TPP-dependent pyruvate/acetoin dehydrogenase alpha subunit
MDEAKKRLNIEIYKDLFLIRRSEEKIIEFYQEDEMKTPMHMSMGEEAITVGVTQALKHDDLVLGTYRSHALYLAKTKDVDNFFAEMYGKDTSLLKGKGGSMHLCAPDNGFLGTSAIVGSVIPVALGVAFANKIKKNGKSVVVFFGDGATEEGVFWESLNVACLMKLPVLFVCEDNGFAVHTHAHQRRGYASLVEIVSKFNCRVFKEETTDAEVIYELASEALKVNQTEQIPCFIHLQYYRYLEHVGVNKDFDVGYRSKEEFDKWFEIDPLRLQRAKLADYGLSEAEIKEVESQIDIKICDSIARAKKAPFSPGSELYKGVYYEDGYLL